jgi:general secretion pathway protein G
MRFRGSAYRCSLLGLLVKIKLYEAALECEWLLERLDLGRKEKLLCLELMAGLPGACYLDRLLCSLRSEDSAVACVAARLLKGKRYRSAVEGLLWALEHSECEVRFHAGISLEAMTGEFVGYNAFAGEKDRAAAVQRWKEWWQKNKHQFPSGPPQQKIYHDLYQLARALKRFYQQNSCFPHQLSELVGKKSATGEGQRPPYLADVPSDPWGRPYGYKLISADGNKALLRCLGEDGKKGGTADAVDIQLDVKP